MEKPRKLHLFINKQCNLNCQYCYWPSHPKEEMPNNISDKIIQYINDNPNKYDYIVFFGGEPMLSYRIIAKFILGIEKRLRYIVMTNGTIHPKMLLDVVGDDYGYNINFTFSYDGLYQMDRSKQAASLIKKHMQYLRETNRASYSVGCIFSPYHYKLIPDNMIETMKYTDTAIFFRICDLPNEWSEKSLDEHIKDFGKIIDIASYYTVCKEKLIQLPNHIEQMGQGNALYGMKGNTCQKSLVYTDICGIDGKKYLCEPAYAHGEEDYGYIWEPRDSYAVEWDKIPENHDCPYHYCLYYSSRNLTFERAMEEYRIKFTERKQKLERLKKAKFEYLLKLDNKGRLLRIAEDYFRNR